jgi:hypothetical protein
MRLINRIVALFGRRVETLDTMYAGAYRTAATAATVPVKPVIVEKKPMVPLKQRSPKLYGIAMAALGTVATVLTLTGVSYIPYKLGQVAGVCATTCIKDDEVLYRWGAGVLLMFMPFGLYLLGVDMASIGKNIVVSYETWQYRRTHKNSH